METVLCGMNEVDSTKIQKEFEMLAEVKANGMTGFQEKFKVCNWSECHFTLSRVNQ